MKDGIARSEYVAVDVLVDLATFSDSVFEELMQRDWADDGLSEVETSIIDSLQWIGEPFPRRGVRLLSMPFLDQPGAVDAAAMESLGDLAYFNPREFDRIMSHPTIRAGITDDWANIVATLFGVHETNPSLVNALLDPQMVTLDSKTIVLPLAGRVDLAVIRLGPGAHRSIDLLEHAVRSAERFMDVPFPTGYVGLLFADAVSGTVAGTNFGTHLAVRPEYDVDDGTHEAQSAAAIISHEVGHYYWSGNIAWIDEGASNLLAIISEYDRVGRRVEPQDQPCAYAPSIQTLEQMGASGEHKSHPAFDCNYSLGERILLDLYRSLGKTNFQRSFGALYLASRIPDANETTEGTPVGISAFREAFSSASSMPTITARWYEGTEPYDLSGLDLSTVNPTLESVNGRLEPIRIALSSDDCATDANDQSTASGEIADWLYVCLSYDYAVESKREVELELAVWFEDGYPWERRVLSFDAEPNYIGGWLSASIGSGPDYPWASGQYYVYIYHKGVKVGKTQFTASPSPPHPRNRDPLLPRDRVQQVRVVTFPEDSRVT